MTKAELTKALESVQGGTQIVIEYDSYLDRIVDDISEVRIELNRAVISTLYIKDK